MDMVRHHMPFYNFNAFPFTQIPYDLLYICVHLIVNNLSPVLRSEYYVVLAQPFCMC
ncbi:hypothetical protein CE91St46_21620 [Eubacteriales bacterium]|nr:hypothetical protein CE91St46_21620 [Eubacteriales bacterium]GKH63774.1 hypothetical protein CE91St47_22430 [Eubacteriales bacterium]